MKCEYCDSVIKTVPDNGICPNCGGVLPEQTTCKEKRRRNLKFPEPPVGTYKDVGGYIKIDKESVTFYRNRWPFTKESTRTIPFYDLHAVSYIPPKLLACGAVCVREWKDREIPLPPKKGFVTDETSVYFEIYEEKLFYSLYSFLKECADIVNEANPT